jgi:hypothetical protein
LIESRIAPQPPWITSCQFVMALALTRTIPLAQSP